MPKSSSQLTIRLLADTAQLNRGLNEANRKLTKFGGAAAKIGGAIALAFSARPIIQFAEDSIKAASDYEEAFSKANVVFGDAASSVIAFSDQAVTKLGLSSAAALEAAGTFGNLLTAFGVGQEQAAQLSKELTQLGADLASFNNTSVEDAIQALRSGLSGETEPLKRYGIVLNDARLRAEALAMGLEVTTKALDPMTKALAAQSLILKDSANAQGDFERTSDQFANTQRQLNAAVEDAKVKIGVGLLNAVQEVVDAMGGANGLVKTIGDAAEEIGDITAGIGVVTGAFVEYSEAVSTATDGTVTLLGLWRAGLAIGTAGLSESLFMALDSLGDIGEEAERAKAETEAMFRVMNGGQGIRLPDHLRQDLNGIAAAAREAKDEVLSMLEAMSQREIRQMDSFGRALDKESIYWKNATDANKRYWESMSSGAKSAGSAVKKTTYEFETLTDLTRKQYDGILKSLDDFTTEYEQTWQKYEDDLRKAEEFASDWSQKMMSNLDIGRAFTLANNAELREAEALKKMNEVLSDPNASARSISNAKNAYYKAAADAATSWQEGFAAQIRDASQFYSLLGDLGDSGLNRALIEQIAALGPDVGTKLATELVGDSGLIGQLNSDWVKVENEARELGIKMADTIGPEVGLTMAQQQIDAYLGQAKKRRKEIQSEIKRLYSVTVPIKFIPDYSAMGGGVSGGTSVRQGRAISPASRGRQVVEDIQAYELVSGRSWRV